MRGGFRGGRSYHPGNRPTLSPPPPPETTRLISTVEAAERERSRVSIVCSINRWKWHEMRRLTPAQSSHLATRLVYRRVCIVDCQPPTRLLPPSPGCSLELFTATTWRRSWFNPGGSSSAMILCFLVEKMGNAFSCGATDYKFSHRKSRLWIWIWI